MIFLNTPCLLTAKVSHRSMCECQRSRWFQLHVFYYLTIWFIYIYVYFMWIDNMYIDKSTFIILHLSILYLHSSRLCASFHVNFGENLAAHVGTSLAPRPWVGRQCRPANLHRWTKRHAVLNCCNENHTAGTKVVRITVAKPNRRSWCCNSWCYVLQILRVSQIL